MLPDEKRTRALLGRSRGAARMRDWQCAEEDLSLLLEREPPPKSAALAMAERRYSEAMEVQRKEAGKPGNRKSRRGTAVKLTHVQKAAVAIFEGREAHAVIEADAPFAHAHYLRGCVRVELDDWLGAEGDFTKWLASSPPKMPHTSHSIDAERALASQRARALQCLGLAQAANRRWSPAVARLTEAIIIDPDARRLCLLARVHTCERQWQLANDRYQDALVLEPDLEMARVGLAQVHIEHEPLPLVTGLL